MTTGPTTNSPSDSLHSGIMAVYQSSDRVSGISEVIATFGYSVMEIRKHHDGFLGYERGEGKAVNIWVEFNVVHYSRTDDNQRENFPELKRQQEQLIIVLGESSILNEHMVVLLPGDVYAISAGYKMEELEQDSMHGLFECSIDVLANIDQVSSVKHFVLEENMLEVDYPCVTPEVVLKASGHVDKFTDLMVKDEKAGTCYRADHLVKEFCSEKLQKDLSITAKEAAELKRILAVLDDLSAEELGAKLKEYGIIAPDTKNPISDPYPFNLMFQTSIGPSGLSPGFMWPETAQGIFVNFKDLYYYNGNKLPFVAAQIG
ncbi:glycine--tRNA ligase, mitochondrial 1-like [Humulus lupulus]|uniref:glycine--tRNA ligase, mitochondrial 1-like n=1 Tax=Humulus lupulus TaxID=3486 RepID=UPI002B40F3D1|nr:glycine--tRNA ligase, mitochondrial 1-like [Humulus lupulus]